MALETGTYISDLNPSNPVGATDKVSTLDDHVRLIKATLQNTFPGIDGAVTATHTELNFLDGVTGTTGTGKLVLDDAPTIADLTVSGTEFEVNADLLDFNGDADISGTLAVGGALNLSGNAISSGAVTWTNTGTLVIGASDTTVRLQGGDNGSGGPGAGFQVTAGGAAAVIRAGGVSAANTVASFAADEIQFDVALFDMNGNADISGSLTVSGASRFESTARSVSAPAVRIGNSGSTNTAGVLSVVTTSNPNLVLFNSTSGVEGLFQVGTSVLIGAETAHTLSFRTNAASRMSIDAAGDVSMTGALSVGGAVTASSTLSVAGAATFAADLSLTGTRTIDATTRLNLTGSTVSVGESGGALGFYGSAGISKPTVGGRINDGTALIALLNQLESLGLITKAWTES